MEHETVTISKDEYTFLLKISVKHTRMLAEHYAADKFREYCLSMGGHNFQNFMGRHDCKTMCVYCGTLYKEDLHLKEKNSQDARFRNERAALCRDIEQFPLAGRKEGPADRDARDYLINCINAQQVYDYGNERRTYWDGIYLRRSLERLDGGDAIIKNWVDGKYGRYDPKDVLNSEAKQKVAQEIAAGSREILVSWFLAQPKNRFSSEGITDYEYDH